MRMKHGIFLPPFHALNENPHNVLHRDLELIEWLDRLGYHEAWIGEHHSADSRPSPRRSCSSPRLPSAPSTSGSEPASSRCPTITP